MSSQPPPFQPQPPSYQNPVQPPLPPAKKTNILVWIFGGIAVLMIGGLVTCGGIAYFIGKKVQNAGFDSDLAKQNPAYAIAKMGATMAPGVEVISSDDSKGIIKIREKDSGKEVTLKFDPEKKTMVVVNEDGFFGAKRQMQVVLSGDHRVFYGSHAALFLQQLAGLIEKEPEKLTLV